MSNISPFLSLESITCLPLTEMQRNIEIMVPRLRKPKLVLAPPSKLARIREQPCISKAHHIVSTSRPQMVKTRFHCPQVEDPGPGEPGGGHKDQLLTKGESSKNLIRQHRELLRISEQGTLSQRGTGRI